MEEDLMGALKKCAVGFGASEVVEEFTVEDGELKLVKKKVTRRDIPPDLKAVKLLMEESNPCSLTDDELENEKQRLLNMLNKEGN
ncbi:MAG: hypothetical protein K2L12_07340 [Clostridia bacterium]|nr:hypothetical protein [Clostridia bacterium]